MTQPTAQPFNYDFLKDALAVPALSQQGAFLHTMTEEDRTTIKDLTLALNRLAAALEHQQKPRGEQT